MRISAKWLFPISGAPIENGAIEVSPQGEIISVGEAEAGDEILDGILVPGFVNAHCHIELSHLVGLFKQGTGMDGFIKQINELRCAVDKEGRIEALTAQMEQLYAQGVSAMADISNGNESFDAKASSPLYTRTYLELFGTEPEDAEQILAGAIELQKEAKALGLDAAPTPHSCYTMSQELNRMAAAEGLKSGFISYHNQESDQENDMIRYGKGELWEDYNSRGTTMLPVMGVSALEYFISNLSKARSLPVEDGRVLLVHNVDTDPMSIEAALKAFTQCYWAICPLSNIFIHRALPNIDMLREHNLNICIGTDSLSSNTLLSMVDEIRCLQEHFPHLQLDEILKWATLNGAAAIGKEDIYGSFEIGKRPGVVLIENTDGLSFTKSTKSKRLI